MFDTRFYREVLPMPRRRVLQYLLGLLLLSGTLSAIADTWYLVQGKRSLGRKIAAAFPGMEIRDGKLHPATSAPYAPPPYLVTPIVNQVLGLPSTVSTGGDSLVVVDTSSSAPLPSRVPVILLKKDEMVVVFAQRNTMRFSYKNILMGTTDLMFTAEALEEFLRRNSAGILFGYLFSTIIHLGTVFLFSIFFLAFAAYIFRVDTRRTLKEYLKMAIFAVTPVAAGSTLVSISGVKVEWGWHLCMLMSMVVIFRAIAAIAGPETPRGEES
jgi:hypothetical protein